MCSVCGTNRNYTAAIIDKLRVAREASAQEQARKDEYNRTCGSMDGDYDCCDSSYQELEDKIWEALQWLGVVERDVASSTSGR
jgi:hypothetical protein